jgi:hypothetical protein
VLLYQIIKLAFELICIALALSLVILFFKTYNTKRSFFLLGLPFGFFFLMFSYIFLGMHIVDLMFQTVNPLSSSLMWLRVVTQTLGIVLITLSYIFASRYQHISKLNYLLILLCSTVLLFSIFGALFVINPAGLSSIYTDTNLFSIVNLVLLSFIILFLTGKNKLNPRKVSTLISAPVAFIFLWFGQLIFLGYAYGGGGDLILIASQVPRVISLALFITIYYMTFKEVSTYADQQTEQS